MWKDLIVSIKYELRAYGLFLRKPATIKEVKAFQEQVVIQLNGFDLPSDYIKFLMTVNGLEFNGLVIYGIDKKMLQTEVDDEISGFIETNKIWHENEWQNRYIFFGDSDIALYCYDLNQKIFLELDKPSSIIMNVFPSFNLMLEDALKGSLE
ncbi:YrhA family protein [Jeotgalibacillus sp. ET6]|uniref:YrhA family protein n=1 Tax=Jeotgalibacillus sp. ET6 TaxID=3037260 RepID=UPI00241827B0|nr:YrhA family protein [Jeotgalibacillus sp. ET6]MDG5471379.1 YrhA family protein [Jeotgalibacillus sp. ET6]